MSPQKNEHKNMKKIFYFALLYFIATLSQQTKQQFKSVFFKPLEKNLFWTFYKPLKGFEKVLIKLFLNHSEIYAF